MPSCIINTPLGFTKISGDDLGISEVTILNSEPEEVETDLIPTELEDATIQLREYFGGIRENFELLLNPQGTNFQQSVWLQLEKFLSVKPYLI